MKEKTLDNNKLEKLQKYLKSKRLKMSQSRRLLYDYLFTMPDNLTMVEIHEKIQEHGV